MISKSIIKLLALCAFCAANAQETQNVKFDDIAESKTQESATPAEDFEASVHLLSFFSIPVEEFEEDKGFAYAAVFTGEQWSNFKGGNDTGTAWNGLLTLGLELDVSKATKISDNLGHFGITAMYYTHSEAFNGRRVALESEVSNIITGVKDMFRVFEMYYANSFKVNDALEFNLRIGTLAADEDFMGSDFAGVFLNSNFGAMPSNFGMELPCGDTAFSQYASSAPGFMVETIYENLAFRLGIYSGSAGKDVSSNNGFNFNFNRGLALWYEARYFYTACELEGNFAFGGNYHTESFLYLDDDTQSQNNFYSFYAVFEQVLLKDSELGDVGIFCRASAAPQENIAAVSYYIEGGVNFFGLIPSRDNDVLGIGVNYMKFGSAYRRAMGSELSYGQTCIEITYKAQITPFFSVQPSFQIYVDPNETNNGGKDTILVLGARLELSL